MTYPPWGHGIYLIADFSLPAARSLQRIESLLSPEIALLQYRDKKASGKQRKQHVAELKALCARKKVPLIINDDVDLALETNADGVHLGASDMPPAQARSLLGQEKIIGVSCYQSLHHAQEAKNSSADYVAFGALFASPTKPAAKRIRLQDFSAYQQSLDIPVCAIGGIQQNNISDVFAAGADLAAVISGIWLAPDPVEALAACIKAMTPRK